MPRFQRARKPEEKEVRRRAILQAARDLAREVGPIEMGLNELGRRSGVSKPNIYRYFESREEILFRLYSAEISEVVGALEARLRAGLDLPAVAAIVAQEHLSRPLLCQLAGMVAAILEHNMSADTIASVKTELISMLPRAAAALRRSLPWLSDADAVFAVQAIELQLAALWPSANPSRAAREVLSRPEFASMCTDAGRDFPRFIEVLLAGLRASDSVTGPPSRPVAARGSGPRAPPARSARRI
ncbi:TetR/AcrR family transcriptional regulator [Anaeromyxobacter oryzae]|uniref:TetR family transcriptional regulator n=1 Tax=Anaeromyxobacter oryzae TaxID=2918170 RepID=A0ABM7WXE3_9BACT|nr:TetR/AcrR family transcriptional regulator [Anaeromyxobacter oryzae]BDG04187.1 TetR family transcriptional regulator [Anaeromyxobacter oryzae]